MADVICEQPLIGRVVRLFRDNGPIPIFRFGCSTSELLKLFIDKPYVDYYAWALEIISLEWQDNILWDLLIDTSRISC